MSRAPKIDVHAHFIPEEYREACVACGLAKPDGMPAIPAWSEEAHVEFMEHGNITRSILSISSPGTDLKYDDENHTIELTRKCNDIAADLTRRRPAQFGFWASLPMPNVEASLEEITRVYGELNADGIALKTNYRGIYLGDARFEAIFERINARSGIIFIHPTTPCLQDLKPATPLAQFPMPIFEFFFDTARAVMNLFISGTIGRYPNIKYIIPHAGGALPPLINRFSIIPGGLKLPGVDPRLNPTWTRERLNEQFYFDVAGWPLPGQLQGLLEYITPERLLYGSDYCFTPMPVALDLIEELHKSLPEVLLREEDREALYHKNAKKLLQLT